jgi:hypothetical protein
MFRAKYLSAHLDNAAQYFLGLAILPLINSRDSLAIFEKLAKQDPSNAGWQADRAFSYWRTGTRLARLDLQSKKDARTKVEKGRDILLELKTRTGLTRQQQQWLDSIEADLQKW